jgi:hypothetical protein
MVLELKFSKKAENSQKRDKIPITGGISVEDWPIQ